MAAHRAFHVEVRIDQRRGRKPKVEANLLYRYEIAGDHKQFIATALRELADDLDREAK